MTAAPSKRLAKAPLLRQLASHREALLACRRCPNVYPPVVCGQPLDSRIFLVGQAPGPREGARGRPFAHTAGKTLFRWFSSIGADEAAFRANVWMAAVLRCFPGKAKSGGDRVPRRPEIDNCRSWMAEEAALLQPRLVIAVGRLAIVEVLDERRAPLTQLVGKLCQVDFLGREVDCIALPHPSGVSSWHKTEPGKTLLAGALQAIGQHPTWRATFGQALLKKR